MALTNQTISEAEYVCKSIHQLDEINPRAVLMIGKMVRLQLKKGHDYSGKQKDTLDNLRRAARLGIPSWIGVLLRMGDKWARLENYALAQEFLVEDEDFDQTCADMANYAIFAAILHQENTNEAVLEGGLTPKDKY